MITMVSFLMHKFPLCMSVWFGAKSFFFHYLLDIFKLQFRFVHNFEKPR